jgi:hypothetical protein
MKEDLEMKASSIKKMLATALVMTTFASSIPLAGAESSTTKSSSSTSAAVSAAVATVSATTPFVVQTNSVKSSVPGVFLAKEIAGAAPTVSLADFKAAFSLTAGQTPYVVVADTNQKKSTAAMASLNAATAVLGAHMGPVLNIDLGAMTKGKFAQLPAGATVPFTIALPANFRGGDYTYSVVGVQAGGVVTVYKDTDSNPNTVTFAIPGGLGCYAVVRK